MEKFNVICVATNGIGHQRLEGEAELDRGVVRFRGRPGLLLERSKGLNGKALVLWVLFTDARWSLYTDTPIVGGVTSADLRQHASEYDVSRDFICAE